MPRIAPADEPYPPEIATALARTKPAGVAPLVLFRTMARNPRVFGKLFAGGLLGKGTLSLRQREVVIDRATAPSMNGASTLPSSRRKSASTQRGSRRPFTARPMPPAGRPMNRRCWQPSTIWSTVAPSVTTHGFGSPPISTMRKSSKRSRSRATTTRSASSAALSTCRSKATPRAFRRESRHADGWPASPVRVPGRWPGRDGR